MKKTNMAISRNALLAAAAVMMGSMSAQAADLGGNCCADLEERVAELEAAAARKGNRKVSLTVSGHVNEAVMFWNDGVERNAYVVSNNVSRTRFRFLGSAKVTSDISAGYLLEIGVRYASSLSRNQTAAGAGGNENNLDIRHSVWYLDSKSLGRVWVGNTSTATDGILGINLANMPSATNDVLLWQGGMKVRTQSTAGNANANSATGITWANIGAQSQRIPGDGDRYNIVRYDTPTLAGFQASTSWGEDDRVDMSLRYAGEFSGVRLAAGVGYSNFTDVGGSPSGCANTGGVNTGPVSGNSCNALGGSASVMHVPTGIFLSGSAGQLTDKNRQAVYTAAAPGVGGINDKDKHWGLKGGIEQKYTALGKTTVYGEYYKQTVGAGLNSGQPRDVSALGGRKFLTESTMTVWGFGLNQNIEAAAMDLYLGYRNYSADLTTSNGVAGAGARTTAFGVNTFHAGMAGAIIKF
jgi:hypothetical protein